MPTPHRLTVALAAGLSVAVTIAGIGLVSRGVVFPILEWLPDGAPFGILKLLLAAPIVWVFYYVGPRLLRWRALLSFEDRRLLFGDGALGAVLGCALGILPAFMVVPDVQMAPVKSLTAMTALFGCGFVVSVGAAFRAAGTLQQFAGPATPSGDEPQSLPIA